MVSEASHLKEEHSATGKSKEKLEDIASEFPIFVILNIGLTSFCLPVSLTRHEVHTLLLSLFSIILTRLYSGVLNEGGLFGERQGWHLPGFDTSDWVERDLARGLPDQKAGVGFFTTTFDLNIPENIDAMFSFNFEESLGQPYRVYMFVNGWMMGKRVANLGYVAR